MTKGDDQTKQIGVHLGQLVAGGETIELIGDVGSGKTTLTKGIAVGLGITEAVQSPTFTISRTYDGRDGLVLRHYDFYRLSDPGIMSSEIAEAIEDSLGVTVIEWSGLVEGVLPADRLRVTITAVDENDREITLEAMGKRSEALLEIAR